MVDQSLMEKLRKLKSLAERAGTVHEAAVAMTKLQELLLKHNLDLHSIDVDQDRSGNYVLDSYDLGTKSNWKRSLMHVIAVQYFCNTVYTPGERSMIIIGEPDNIRAVKFSFELIVAQLNRICEKEWQIAKSEDFGQKSYNEQLLHEQNKYEPFSSEWLQIARRIIEGNPGAKINAKSWRNNFYIGAVHEINKRLTEERKKFSSSEQGNALVLVKDDEVKEATDRLVGPTSKSSYRFTMNKDAYERGKKAGRGISMDQELTGSTRSLGSGEQ